MTALASPTDHTFGSQRLTLSYSEWGNRDDPLLLLVHGGRDQNRSWDWVARKLATTYRVIAYDLRGHGRSDWVNDGAYTIMDHVFDLASCVRHLKADRKAGFTLMGHSLGGNIALRYAGLYPEHIHKLIAIEGLGPSPAMLKARAAEALENRLMAWIEQRRTVSARTPRIMADLVEAKARMRAAHDHLREDQIHHLTEHGVRTNADGTLSWCYDPAAVGRSASDISQAEFETLLGRISCPTWLVYGSESWASNPEKDGRLQHFKHAHVTEIKQANHWVHHDQFDAFMAGLQSFLAG